MYKRRVGVISFMRGTWKRCQAAKRSYIESISRSAEWRTASRPSREGQPSFAHRRSQTLSVSRWIAPLHGLLILAVCHGQVKSKSASPQETATPLRILTAAEFVLQHHPLIQYRLAQVEIDRGLNQQAAAAFDTTLLASLTQTRLGTPLTKAQQEENALTGVFGATELAESTLLTAGASRLFRSGVAISPTVTFTRYVDDKLNPGGVNTANPGVAATIPLLRGLGKDAVTAQEKASQIEIDASLLDLTEEVSELLTQSASDYWNLVAAQKLLQIAVEAEERAKTDLENTQTLVDAGQLPRENLNEVNANLDQYASNRVVAEQNLASAQSQLALDMGADAKEITAVSVSASDDFPNIDEQRLPNLDAPSLERYLQRSLLNRSDYLAFSRRTNEQKVLVVAAKNQLLPQLNLSVSAGYSGLAEGRQATDIFTSAGSNVGGVNASGGISYNFAPRNDRARGALQQALSTQSQIELQGRQLSHAINAEVVSQAQAVHHAALQARTAHQAVALYRASLDGQREKYHLGTASVIDVLAVEDRLTTALTSEVQADLSFATALAQFRFATGTLVTPGQKVQTISAEIFQTLPNLDSAQ